jgi:regulator of sigma E protease
MTLLAFFVLLGVLITVHEAGHFIVAKLTGVRVLTFSIGFGPKLIGFTRGETEYRLSILPLGGYVRMYGDDMTEVIPDGEKHRAFLEKPTLQKMAIAAAGPAANLILPLVLFFALGVGSEQVAEPVVGTVLAGEPAEKAGLVTGDRITAVDDTPINTFSDLIEAISVRPGTPTRLTVTRAGATAPVILTVTPSSATSPDPTASGPIGRIGMLVTRPVPVVTVAAGSPAATAGVVAGDRIVDVGGTAIATREALLAALDAADPTLPLTITVERTATDADKGAADKGAAPTRQQIVVPAPVLPACVPVAAAVVEPVAVDPAVVDPAVAVDPVEAVPVPVPPCVVPEVEVSALRFAVLAEDVAKGPVQQRLEATNAAVKTAVSAQLRRRGLASIDGVVAAVEPDSPAGARGLVAAEHRVVAVDGAPLGLVNELPQALAKDLDGIHTIGLVDGKGQGATLTFLLQPSTRRELGGQKILGVSLRSAQGDAPVVTRDVSVADAAVRAVTTTGDTIRSVVAGYVMLFTGRVGLDQLGGPVMLATIAGEAARSGVEVFAGTMALLSVNLALLNLLPVPVLDGGHLLLFTVEAIRRKRLSVEARLRATKVGLFFVGGLMLVALFNDVTSLFR